VTIGELYLAQGHRREAIAIFRRVLAADPENDRAREALERLGVLKPPAASKGDRKGRAEAPAAKRPGQVGGLTIRRIAGRPGLARSPRRKPQ